MIMVPDNTFTSFAFQIRKGCCQFLVLLVFPTISDEPDREEERNEVKILLQQQKHSPVTLTDVILGSCLSLPLSFLIDSLKYLTVTTKEEEREEESTESVESLRSSHPHPFHDDDEDPATFPVFGDDEHLFE